MYEQLQSSLEREKLKRKAIRDAMLNSPAYNPYQQVSGRSIPYSPIQGLTEIGKALIDRSNLASSEARSEDIIGEMGAERENATQRVLDAYMGRESEYPVSITGEELAGPPTPDIQADPEQALLMAASDPYTKDLSGTIEALMKAKRGGSGSFARPIVTSEGIYEQTERGWQPMIGAKGDVLMGGYVDPALQGRLAGSKEKAKLAEQLETKPDIEKEVLLAEREAEKIITKPKIESGLEAGLAKTEMLDSTIDQAIDESGTWTSGFLGATTSWVPGTPAYDLGKTLETIKANIGFDKLQEMRANSPTGGALGQVSERENTLLQSVWNSVEQAQSPEQLKENLEKVRRQVKESWKRVKDAYEDTYGVPYEPKKSMAFDEDKERRYQEWKARQ
jgi:hypothetical protein